MHTPTLQASRTTKKTSAGEIPMHWIVCSLGECFSLASGDTKPVDTESQPSPHNQIPVYGGNGVLGYTSLANSTSPEIIIGRVGENCGAVHYVEGSHWTTDNALFTKEWTEEHDLRFFYYLLQHLNLGRLRNKGGQPLISQKPIYDKKVGLPPLSEQRKIATVLVEWDLVLEQQERLLTAKQKLKRGLMQRLLTGQTRFKEFDRQIIATRLGKHVEEVVEVNKSEAVTDVLSVTNSRGFVSQNEHFSKRVASAELHAYRIVRKGQFAFNPSRVNVGSIARLLNCEAGVLSPMYEVFAVDEKTLSGDFMSHLIESHSFQQQLKSFLQGSVRQSLSFDGLASMKFWIPSLDEQQRISAVLDNCDREIELLQKQLQALKEQKRGLMQKLLTGEVRVKVPKEK